ncbi:iron dicitrate transport regulator FecR [Sphingobium sp. SCG-1]|uniref:FecR family protein n=1 Tax=Sphingobium sp. SCG-1 TaxID=2072936 RepID=UPI000CD6A958|nr:FecR family protein [Sphingobium sp. SCG-1]AUW57583.1 iron dicitrate transport regulator FecR [Sphingobium sp. SCG-1]
MAASADDPLPKSIIDEAARWIAVAEGDALSAEKKAALNAWLAVDPRHARAFAAMQDIWAHMAGVPETLALRASLLAAADRRSRRSLPRATGPRRQRWIGPALAASLALMFIGIAADLPTRLQADEMTATGERRIVKLPDGSTVHLDTHSAVALDFVDGRRVVRLLGGEAAFIVAPDPHRPFTVEASGGSATALGTRFLVRRDADGARVMVTEHSVRVTYPVPQGSSAVVTEGQSLAYGQDGLGHAAPANTADAMAWTEGVLVFRNTPLTQVVAEIGRYHRGYFRVLGEAQTLRVSGVFHIDDPVAAINQLQRSLGLNSTRLTNRLIFISG